MSEEPENSVESTKNDNTVVHKVQKWRIPKPDTAVIVCVSSRALFDMTEERKIWEEQGMQAYVKYMIANEDTPLKQGSALPFIRALNIVNEKLLKLDPNEKHLFDVVLMSNNHAQVGVALINSINHYDLTVERFCLTAGNSVIGYLEAYETDLYLSVDMCSVIEALSIGIASAALSAQSISEETCTQLRVAFDGDAVLFSDEAEIQAKKYGLDKFFEYESERVDEPLAVGPLHKFAMILGSVKKKFHDRGVVEDCPIRTYLVTARSAASSGKRALKTLRKWGLDIDEALFLAGAPKGPILEKIRPHIFFDDQKRNIQSGRDHGVTSAHVPYGITQTHP